MPITPSLFVGSETDVEETADVIEPSIPILFTNPDLCFSENYCMYFCIFVMNGSVWGGDELFWFSFVYAWIIVLLTVMSTYWALSFDFLEDEYVGDFDGFNCQRNTDFASLP